MSEVAFPNATHVDAVVRIARQAGDAIMDVYSRRDLWDDQGGRGLFTQKADASPLTLADLAAHRVIVAGLRELTPEIPVVSEEDEGSHSWRKPVGEFWLVDPLDGTKEFIARRDDFTVNIALVRDGLAIFGVVYAPALNKLYWGGVGLGAFSVATGQSAVAIHVAVPNPGAALRVVASKSHLNPETEAFLARLPRHHLVQAGSSLKFCRIAEGTADVYPRLGPTCEWDTAAAQAVVEAAGGLVSTLAGDPLGYGKAEVVNPYFVAAAQPLTTFEVLP